MFQYPLMDRLYFGGAKSCGYINAFRQFQYPLMDRLYFGGEARHCAVYTVRDVSVSSDGSFVFWGVLRLP